jgi:hypothetical protein
MGGRRRAVAAARLLPWAENTPLVFAGASQAGLMLTAHREQHVRRAALIGSATEAFASAMRSMVALEAGLLAGRGVARRVWVCPPPAWWCRGASGHRRLRAGTHAHAGAPDAARCPSAKLWPPGDPYALGGSCRRSRRGDRHVITAALSVLTVLDGEYGVRDRLGSIPALLDAGGVARVRCHRSAHRERGLGRDSPGRGRPVSISHALVLLRPGVLALAAGSGRSRRRHPAVRLAGSHQVPGVRRPERARRRLARAGARRRLHRRSVPPGRPEAGGDSGTWFQRFELVAGLNIGDGNELSISHGGKTLRFTLGTSY